MAKRKPAHRPAGTRPLAGQFIAACSCGFETPTCHTAEAAHTHLVDRHVTKVGFPPCPTRRRIKYATAEQAARRLRTWQQEVKPGQKIPTRIYQCRCGWWHLTSTPIRQETSA